MTLHVHDMMAETQAWPPDVLIPQDSRLPSLTALGKNTDLWYEPLSLNRTNMQAAAVSDFTLDTLNAHFSHLHLSLYLVGSGEEELEGFNLQGSWLSFLSSPFF